MKVESHTLITAEVQVEMPQMRRRARTKKPPRAAKCFNSHGDQRCLPQWASPSNSSPKAGPPFAPVPRQDLPSRDIIFRGRWQITF